MILSHAKIKPIVKGVILKNIQSLIKNQVYKKIFITTF